MALLFMDGFDVGDFALKSWTTYTNDNGTASVATGRVSGSAVAVAMPGSGAANRIVQIQRLIPATTQITMGVAVRLTVDSSGSGGFNLSLYGDSGVTQHLTLMSEPTTKAIQLRLGSMTGTVLQTSGSIMTPNAWVYLEIQATIADAGGICVVRLNGASTPIINFTGDTKNGGTATTTSMIALGSFRSQNNSAETAVYDDLYILDNTGTINNTFLGDVRIASLQPNGVGTDTQLTPTGSVTNWQNVDEIPYSTTDYNGSSTVGLRDTYTLTDLPGSVTTVHALQSNIIASKSDVTTASAKIPIRTGGNVYYGATNSLSTTYLTYSDMHSINPNTTVAWTTGDVNGLEAGMEVA